jgi:hypothetical protein
VSASQPETLRLFLLAHRLIAKLGERSVEGARHPIDVCLKSSVGSENSIQ